MTFFQLTLYLNHTLNILTLQIHLSCPCPMLSYPCPIFSFNTCTSSMLLLLLHADGVRFMSMSSSGYVFRLASCWGFTAHAIGLGSSYFQVRTP